MEMTGASPAAPNMTGALTSPHQPGAGPEEDIIGRTAADAFRIPFVYPYQRLVIHGTLEAGGYYGAEGLGETNPRRIVVLPTGAGKSLCFILPALLLEGITLIIFPLLGLMNDQARRLSELSIPHGTIRGGQSADQRDRIFEAASVTTGDGAGIGRDATGKGDLPVGAVEGHSPGSGTLKILISNPEALLSPAVLPRLKKLSIAHIVIDETHTVSEWGDTFRPAYLRVAEIIEAANPRLVTAFTATASPHILERIEEVLFPAGPCTESTADSRGDPRPQRILANPDRPNISYSVLPVLSKTRALVRLLTPGSSAAVKQPAIVFCRSRDSARLTASALRRRLEREDIMFYHAGLLPEEKKRVERWFFESRTGILCSTCAYGMGVDKSDVRTVIHRDLPPSVEAYLQESGRGGRDREPAAAYLLFSPEDPARSREIADPASKSRYEHMIGYATAGGTCRREYLLSLLGASAETCETCDICAGIAVREPPELSVLTDFFRKNGKIASVGKAVRILKGELSFRSREEEAWRFYGWGFLYGWDEEDIKEAVQNLVCAGILMTGRKGKHKNLLRYRRKVPRGFREER